MDGDKDIVNLNEKGFMDMVTSNLPNKKKPVKSLRRKRKDYSTELEKA